MNSSDFKNFALFISNPSISMFFSIFSKYCLIPFVKINTMKTNARTVPNVFSISDIIQVKSKKARKRNIN